MKALIQLEERILAELNEVQDIQNRLANSRMVKNLDQSHPQSIFLKDHDDFENSYQKSTTSANSKGLQKTKFIKRVSTLQTDNSHSTLSQVSLISKEKSGFKPSLHLLSALETASHQTEDTCSDVLEPKCSKKVKKGEKVGRKHNVVEKNKEKRRWSLLECEDEVGPSLSRKRKPSNTPLQKNKTDSSINNSASKSQKRKFSRETPISIVVAENNKENYSQFNLNTPGKSKLYPGERLSNTPQRGSLLNSKKKAVVAPEYSFRPQLSSNSMRIAEALVRSFD
jgi:hypothetical protein